MCPHSPPIRPQTLVLWGALLLHALCLFPGMGNNHHHSRAPPAASAFNMAALSQAQGKGHPDKFYNSDHHRQRQAELGQPGAWAADSVRKVSPPVSTSSSFTPPGSPLQSPQEGREGSKESVVLENGDSSIRGESRLEGTPDERQRAVTPAVGVHMPPVLSTDPDGQARPVRPATVRPDPVTWPSSGGLPR